MKLKNLLILIIPVFLFSCMSTPKNIVYFQDLDKYPQKIGSENDWTVYEPIIKKFDELMITVTAPVLDQEAVAQFNLPLSTVLTSDEARFQQSISVQTYIVDHDGTINYPVIGRIPLAGLTKSQAIETIRKSVSNYVDDPVVSLKILSYKVTIIGEVAKPGNIPITQDRISILDAIGAAGDLTIYGNRQNVLLIRENNDGSPEYLRFDLTTSDLFLSPYYYLQQNDVIVVEPNKSRQMSSKFGAADGYRLSVFSMLFSAVSIIASTAVAIISIGKSK